MICPTLSNTSHAPNVEVKITLVGMTTEEAIVLGADITNAIKDILRPDLDSPITMHDFHHLTWDITTIVKS